MKVLSNPIMEKSIVIDQDTGEVIDEGLVVKTDIVVAKDAEGFFMTYTALLGVLENLTGAEVKLMQYLCTDAQFNTNLVSINKVTIQEICEKTGLSKQTVRNCTTALKKKDMIIALGSGMYRINPRYYWKGIESQRRQTYKYVLEVECPDC